MNKNLARGLHNSRLSVFHSTLLALVGFAAFGAANAATLVVENSGGYFIAEAYPEGEGYQYTFSVTPNLAMDYQQHNSVSGRCLQSYGYGTVYVTVTYPNNHVESTQRGVSCRLPGWGGN